MKICSLAGAALILATSCRQNVKVRDDSDAELSPMVRVEVRIVRAKTLRLAFTTKDSRGVEMNGSMVMDDRNRFRIEFWAGYESMMKRGAAIICDGKKVVFAGNVGPAKPYDAPPDLGLNLRRVFARGGVLNVLDWVGTPKPDQAELPLVTNQSIFHKWTLRVKYQLVEEPENPGDEIFLHLDGDTFLPQSRTIKKSWQTEETYTAIEVDGAVAESEFELFK